MRAFFKLAKYEELISSSPHSKAANSTFLSLQKFEMENHVPFELAAVFRYWLSNSLVRDPRTEKLVNADRDIPRHAEKLKLRKGDKGGQT